VQPFVPERAEDLALFTIWVYIEWVEAVENAGLETVRLNRGAVEFAYVEEVTKHDY